MSGHSKWAQIKRKKAVTDGKKGTTFTKLAKNIALAAKHGKDPDMNPSLRNTIIAARDANMPKENIEKAILKGAGEVPGVSYEEVVYEGFAPGGVAIIVECVTDNTNRTVNEMRLLFSKHGGTLGSGGSVLYMFEQKGALRFAHDDIVGKNREDIELAAIDAGAEDITHEEEGMTIQTARANLATLRDALVKFGIKPSSSGIEWFAATMVTPFESGVEKLHQLIKMLEEHDDVNNVYTNANA